VLNIATNARRLEITKDGRFLYVGRANLVTPDGGYSTYAVDVATGGLTFSLALTFTNVMGVTTDPTSGKFCVLYSNMTSGITGYHKLNCGNAVDTANYPYHLTFDRTGQFIFVIQKIANKVTAFARNASGGLIPDKVNEQNTQTDPSWVSIDPKRNFIYVANTGSDSVSVYTLNPSNGAIRFLQDISAGNQPIVVEVVASD